MKPGIRNASIILLVLSMLAALGMSLRSTAQAAPPLQVPIYTPTPGPDGRIIYIVQANDTLLRISLISGVPVDQLRALVFEFAHQAEARQRHRPAVQLAQEAGNGQEARMVNMDAGLDFDGRGLRAIAGAQQADQRLPGEPGLRRDDGERPVLRDAEHALADEQAGAGSGCAGEERAEHHQVDVPGLGMANLSQAPPPSPA